MRRKLNKKLFTVCGYCWNKSREKNFSGAWDILFRVFDWLFWATTKERKCPIELK